MRRAWVRAYAHAQREVRRNSRSQRMRRGAPRPEIPSRRLVPAARQPPRESAHRADVTLAIHQRDRAPPSESVCSPCGYSPFRSGRSTPPFPLTKSVGDSIVTRFTRDRASTGRRNPARADRARPHARTARQPAAPSARSRFTGIRGMRLPWANRSGAPGKHGAALRPDQRGRRQTSTTARHIGGSWRRLPQSSGARFDPATHFSGKDSAR